MAYRQGDIVLVSFPFTDLTSSKRLIVNRIGAPRTEKMEGSAADITRLLLLSRMESPWGHRSDGALSMIGDGPKLP